MYCQAIKKLVDMHDCNNCWNGILDGNGGEWHNFCRQANLSESKTILERLWETDKQTVLRLAALNLLSENTIQEVLGVELDKVEKQNPYERLMSHNSFKRIRGAIRQVMWG